jgi:CRISPR-associated endonuclease/helicase Cas3
LAKWLSGAVPDDAEYLLAVVAAAGHHRKFTASAVAAPDEGAGTEIRLLTEHEDFARVTDLARAAFSLPAAPTVPTVVIPANRRSRPEGTLSRFEEEWDEARAEVGDSRKLLALCKALVLAADVAGSALPRAGEGSGWIAQELAHRADGLALRGIADLALRGLPPRPFQLEVAESREPVTLVTAGCGTGKTLGAYLWASEVGAGRQIWFTYPTTGTATEGFRDYVVSADVDGRLEHSRAAVDLEILGLDGHAPERDQLESLRLWGAKVVTATVDALLGIVQNQRKGLTAWPGIAHSALIFDEVHAYDDRLFGALCRFLEALPGLPVLLMTASLPDSRRERLEEVVRRAHGSSLREVKGPEALEELPRYLLRRDLEPEAEVARCLDSGGKVLWVSNTVNRCVAVGDHGSDRRPEIYHSRFRYRDRVARHASVIEAFRHDGVAFATTTQVAEMSLDLSADLLVTDLAPVPALIQRLGRLNRRSTPETPIPPRPFLVIPFHGNPYDDEALAGARCWLDSLPERDLSQRDLVAAWEQTDREEAPVYSRWLDGGFHTVPDALREDSPGLTVILAEDARAVEAGEADVEEVALPMPPPPRDVDWRNWRRVAWTPVAPSAAIHYDPRRGARWARA